jgi:hypothetical protein
MQERTAPKKRRRKKLAIHGADRTPVKEHLQESHTARNTKVLGGSQMRDTRKNWKYLFDMGEGEKFDAKDQYGEWTAMEIVSPFGMEGLPYGLGVIAGTRKRIKENIVYAVDTKHRMNIYKFRRNAKVVPV